MRNNQGKPVTTPLALLNSYLTPEQRKTYKDHGVIFVTSNQGQVFAIGAFRHSVGQYVFTMYDGRPNAMLHVWAVDYTHHYNMPGEGSLLAQLLFIECDPRTLVDTACTNSVPYEFEAQILRAGPPKMKGWQLAGWKEPKRRLLGRS